jgi:AcrR family transcriptional regulator
MPSGARNKKRADNSPKTRNLDLERIASVGLAIVDERGPAALTMRAVAEQLGVTPMSLYHHVANKSALVALVVDRAITERALPERTGATWQDDLCVLGHWMRERLAAHPATSDLRRRYQVWSSAIYAIGEQWLVIWSDSGLPPAAAQRAAATSAMAVLGVLEERLFQPRVEPPEDPQLESSPHLRDYVAVSAEIEDDFELLLRALAEGLYAQLSVKRPRVRAAAKKRGKTPRKTK